MNKKVALVTGAGRGIGKTIAKELALSGYDVVINYNTSEKPAKELYNVLKDLNNNYQYKAFGIPWLGFKRGLENDFVISPYSTFLSLEDSHRLGIENLEWLEYEGSIIVNYGKEESIHG